MCGICGIVHLNGDPVSVLNLQRMMNALAHRGPDGEGSVVHENVGLGHRRLAIIDTSPGGNQPMQTEGGRFRITYNGELYNFQELRVELESLGHRFHSRSDTEVVLRCYLEWGSKCVDRFNGMFAFAVHDTVENLLFMARDRYGIKPLYYTFVNGCFLFASEQKAFIQHHFFARELDKEALLEYFTFQNLFTNKTFFKGVHSFPPGHYGYINTKSHEGLRFHKYWDFHFSEPEARIGRDEYLEELDRLFHQAVNRQMVSDVEIGTYLSGGMDSGSITAISALQLPELKTFTCGFDLNSASGLELAYDERELSEYMSYLFKTEHYEVVLKAGDMERILGKVAWHIEEPRVGQSYPNYYVSRLASKFVKVVLSGTGGDEIFAGYPWRYHRKEDCSSFSEYVDNYYAYWMRLIPNKQIQEVFGPIWNDVKHVWTRDIFYNVLSQSGVHPKTKSDFINNSLYFEAKTFLHGLLVVEDKLSMANGLETRVPFLDNDLVDFAMQMPVSLKLESLGKVERINENEPGGSLKKYPLGRKDGKLILRSCMEKYLPQRITRAKKQGFSAPDASWFKGESLDLVRSVIFDDKSHLYDYFDKKSLRRLVQEHLDGKINRRLLIWSLLNFNEWIKQYLQSCPK